MDKKTETNNLNTTQKLRFFSSTGQSYEFTANSKEKFNSIYDNFNKSYNFTNSNKKPIALCNGENVQFDKNLEQNNITDDSSVVLVIQDENESESMQNQLMQQQMISQQNMQESMMSMMANQISQQQVQMEKMLNSNCGNQKQQGNEICVIFRNNSANGKNSAPITIQCMKNEKVSTLIEKYRNKTNDRDLTEKFVFNANTLDPQLFVFETGITDGSHIFIVETKGVDGAYKIKNN